MPEASVPQRVLVSVGGSVAAYRSCDVVTALRQKGIAIRVAMTDGAQNFITPTTLAALSGNPVATSLFATAATGEMAHLDLATWADVHAIVAASANLIARLALGFADDVVTTTALASAAPLLIAPAMETAMWQHPATVTNVATLRERGARFVGPVTGRLASGRDGEGRLETPSAIVDAIVAALGERGA